MNLATNRWATFEGHIVDGKYHLQQFLGAGKFGGVFLASHVVRDHLVREVAIKLIEPNPGFLDRQLRELTAATTLNHPGLLRCFDAGQCILSGIELLYLVMERAEETLGQRLQQGTLDHTELRKFTESIVPALDYLHRERDCLVHCDLKPDNLLFVDGIWKISDFGLVRALGDNTAAYTRDPWGTLLYMPPESFHGVITPAWDFWSLGVIIVEAMTGTLPFASETPAALQRAILDEEPQLPVSLVPPFDSIVRGCLLKDRRMRWSAQRVLRVLKGGIAGAAMSFLTVGKNQDGRMELFYTGLCGSLRHNWQTDRNWKWHGEEPLIDGERDILNPAAQVTVGRNEDGRLELFYLEPNGSIWHKWQTQPNGSWQAAEPLNGRAKQIVVGQNEDRRLEIFYIGMDDGIWNNWQTRPNGPWHGETPLEGRAKQITVGRNADGRLELFYVGMDDGIWNNWQVEPNSRWHGETPFGGRAKQIVVGQNEDGRLEIFYISADDSNTIWHNWQVAPNGKWRERWWHGEEQLQGRAKQLAVGRNRKGCLELFYVGMDDSIWHTWQKYPNGTWSREVVLESRAKQIALGQNEDGRLELFHIGTDDSLWHNWQTESDLSWHGEEALNDVN